MQLELLPSSLAPDRRLQFASSYLADRRLAVDAGSLGHALSLDDQAAVGGMLLTHAHVDHIASFGQWVLHAYETSGETVVVHAHEATIAALRTHILNGVIWAPLEELEGYPGKRFLRFEVVEPGVPFELAGYEVTSCAVDHQGPTFGYLVDDGRDAVLFGADSGPTEGIWRLARDCRTLRAVLLELSFPDSMAAIAAGSGHHCPTTFRAELAKLPAEVRVYATHLKPHHLEELLGELGGMEPGRVDYLEPGVPVTLR